ncbi:Bacterial membrane flanked domain protein [Rubripirellula tenax]|uniref:Bacterial membrane flanked domain protein n=1 Tax=Rubripirellula tenax TaxID=2528015 RepID=A0A5C6ERA2_9BACT|nr:PH domain-containing protein [Rubripirellula tenax]TWU50924.1 Bacterial membrane flanked domain protein [Rubripirellula tenax]
MSTDPNQPIPANVDPSKGSVPDDTATERFQREVAARKAAELDHDEEEETLWAGGYNPKAMLGTWILMAMISIALLILPFFVSPLSMGIAVGLIALIWVVGCLLYAYRRLGYHYELTTQRFIHQTGILSRQTDRIEVIDIDDVSFSQGPVQRMFGVGNIELTGSDRTHPTLSMLGIGNVKDVSGLIDDIRRKERRRRSLHIESI